MDGAPMEGCTCCSVLGMYACHFTYIDHICTVCSVFITACGEFMFSLMYQ